MNHDDTMCFSVNTSEKQSKIVKSSIPGLTLRLKEYGRRLRREGPRWTLGEEAKDNAEQNVVREEEGSKA